MEYILFSVLMTCLCSPEVNAFSPDLLYTHECKTVNNGDETYYPGTQWYMSAIFFQDNALVAFRLCHDPVVGRPTVTSLMSYNFFLKKRMFVCPFGYFLQTLYLQEDARLLNDIKYGKCTKVAGYPDYYKECYLAKCTRIAKLCSCYYGYYAVGFLINFNCHVVRCVIALKCCSMHDKPMSVVSYETLTQYIMENTLYPLSVVGKVLGWVRVGDPREKKPYIGSGYKRNTDGWLCDKRMPYVDYCDRMLQIFYLGWSFQLVKTRYGQNEVQSLDPETLDSGEVVNNSSTEASTRLSFEYKVMEPIAHTATESWDQSHSLGIKIIYKHNGINYAFTYSTSQFNTKTNVKEYRKTLGISNNKKFDPYTINKWKLLVNRTRVLTPYTAIVRAKFSVMFSGEILSEVIDPSLSGLHLQKYFFGNESVPFYTALNEKFTKESPPFDWYLHKNHPYNNLPFVQCVEYLTDEKLYEFEIHGVFDAINGTSVNVYWDDAIQIMKPKKQKRENLPTGSNITIKGKKVSRLLAPEKPFRIYKPMNFVEFSNIYYNFSAAPQRLKYVPDY